MGYWSNDQEHGFGTEEWPDGSKYEGSYINGKKEGVGIFYSKDGNKYMGKFKNNFFEGIENYSQGLFYFNRLWRIIMVRW